MAVVNCSIINDLPVHEVALLILICSQIALTDQQSESGDVGTAILPMAVRPAAVPAGAAVKMGYT